MLKINLVDSNFILATLISFHYYVCKTRVKLANLEKSFLNKRKWQKLVLMNTFCVLGISQCYDIDL